MAKNGFIPETDMIERVAKAIWLSHYEERLQITQEFRIWEIEDPNCSSSCEVPEFEKDEYREMAQAAIAAMLGIKCGRFDYGTHNSSV